MATRTAHTTMRAGTDIVVGYVRVSTDEQGESGAGLTSQREAIAAEITKRAWTLTEIFEDVSSGKSTEKRPGLAACIKAVRTGTAGTLMVAKLDRLSRSMLDTASLLDESHRAGWSLVAIDVGVDTSTPAGELVGHVMASIAQWERRTIGERTKTALGVKRAQGVKLGRPTTVDPATLHLIRVLRAAGQSYQGVADVLNAAGTPTAQGGARWHASTVRAIFLGAAA